jgi:hypothetical protein
LSEEESAEEARDEGSSSSTGNLDLFFPNFFKELALFSKFLKNIKSFKYLFEFKANDDENCVN